MWGTRPVSVQTSVRMTLLGVMLALVATPLICHDFLRRSDAYEADAALASAVAHGAAPVFASARMASRDDLREGCNRLVDLPDVLAVSIWDPSGRLLAHASRLGRSSNMLRAFPKAEQVAAAPMHVALRSRSPEASGAAHLAFARLDGRVFGGDPHLIGVLVQADPKPEGVWAHFLFFGLPVVAVGLLVFCLGSWWMGREVVRPISSLAEVDEDGVGSTAHSFERNRELGKIAERLVSLQGALSAWRNRAQSTERRMDQQVALETQQISRALKRMRREAWLDPLTRVNNRRFLEDEFKAIFDAQRAASQDLSVVMLDLDHFKLLNDTLGHAAGDEVLRFVGELLRQCLRTDDIAVRYGGDEFAMILPGVTMEEAGETTDRILKLFTQRAKMMVNVDPVPSLTAGIASVVRNSPVSELELLAFADKALLVAKKASKGRTGFSQAVGSTASRIYATDLTRGGASTAVTT
jgi:diguanylate cyclase (GGDEF)-like protein